MKKSIFLILAVFIFSTSPGFVQDIIQQLPTKFNGAQYMFTVFGDTRTSELGSLDGHDVVFSLARNKVFQSISEQLTHQKASFSLFTGDLIWQGGTPVYWEEPGNYFPEAVRSKIFPIPGNHETWNDPLLTNYFAFFPHLEKNHNYYFTVGNSLFLSLCTGGYVGEYSEELSFAQDRKFTCTQGDYTQLQLPSTAVKEIYAEKGVKEVFWAALGSTTQNRTQRINYWTVEVDNAVNLVTITEKVLTFTGRESVFVNGLTIVNGQL